MHKGASQPEHAKLAIQAGVAMALNGKESSLPNTEYRALDAQDQHIYPRRGDKERIPYEQKPHGRRG